MSQQQNGTVSEWNDSVKPAYGFIDVQGVDRYVAFSIEDVLQEEKDKVLKVGAQVTFIYEPETHDQAADRVRLAKS